MALVPSLIPGWGTKIPQAVWGGQQNNKRKPSAQVTNHIQLKLLLNCPLEKYHIYDWHGLSRESSMASVSPVMEPIMIYLVEHKMNQLACV